VSEGSERPARFLPARKAMGFGNTWGLRAGACRQRLGCVFRGVELGLLPAYLQPVDLHILKHDRRRPHEVAGDSRCRADSGRLVCRRGIYGEDYAMWIVPERLAEAAGPAALERAVAEGLNGPRSADIFTLLGR
jgi:colicin import membrane protein